MVMREIARNALTHVLDAKKGEHLLVVTDEQRIEIGNAFYEAGDQLGLEGRMFVIEDEERPLVDLPHDLKRALEGAQIVVNVFVAHSEETPFRVALIKTAAGTGARVGHGPGISDDMMIEGAMRVDFETLRDIGETMVVKVEGAVRAHVTTPEGTDLWLNVKDRAFEHDVGVSPGSFGNLPNGEMRAGPVETDAQGTLVCDSSIGDLGKVPTPVTIEVVDGRITSISGDDAALVERIEELTSVDEQASVIGELGIGINPAARVIGNMLEDEKVAGTVHIAFGNNADMPGGKNTSKTHRDFHMRRPTLTMEFEDGQTRTIVQEGRLLE
jgi:leucyl aminopeptidase (aminopeptidase T)